MAQKQQKKVSNKFWYLQIIMGISIILFLVFTINVSEMSDAFYKSAGYLLLLAALVYAFNNIVMSYRLHYITKTIGKKLRFKSVFLAHMSGMIASDITPAKAGYMYAAVPLKRNGLDVETSISAILFCYISDAIIKVIVVVIGILYLSQLIDFPSELQNMLGAGIVLSVLVIMCFLFFFSSMFSYGGVLGRSKFGGAIAKVSTESNKFWKIFPALMFFSIVGWIFRGIEWYLLAKAFELDLDIIAAFVLYPLTAMLSLMQFSIFDIGVQDVGVHQVFDLLGLVGSSFLFVVALRSITLVVDSIGLIDFFSSGYLKRGEIKETYEKIEGDIDEASYNSNILAQRYWQRKRVRELVENLNLEKGDKVLDVACGSGVVSHKCVEKGAFVYGIDININAIEYANGKNIDNSTFLVADAQNLPFKSGYFDAVICCEVIEHLHNPEFMIDEVSRVLKENGKICVFTPNSRSLWSIIEYVWDKFGKGRNYGETHLKIFNMSEMKKTLYDYELYCSKTFFLMSPFVALLNFEWLLNRFEPIEVKMTDILNIGAEIGVWGILKKKCEK